MTYSESAAGKMITFERALRELKRHSLDIRHGSRDRREFEQLCWNKHKHTPPGGMPWDQVIDAEHVMAFLGY